MRKFRGALVLLGVCATLLSLTADAFARGGGGRGGGGRGGGAGGGRGGMQQPQEDPAIAADRQEISSATAALNTANLSYVNAVKTFSDDFMKQPEYADLQKAVDDANKAVDAARDAVIKKLKAGSPEYKAATTKEADAKKKLDQINANGGNRDQRAAQAQAILDAGNVVVKIENDSLDKDVSLQEAKKKLADAVAALKVEKEKLAEAIKSDASLAALKTTRDTAQTTLDDANKKLRTDLAAAGR